MFSTNRQVDFFLRRRNCKRKLYFDYDQRHFGSCSLYKPDTGQSRAKNIRRNQAVIEFSDYVPEKSTGLVVEKRRKPRFSTNLPQFCLSLLFFSLYFAGARAHSAPCGWCLPHAAGRRSCQGSYRAGRGAWVRPLHGRRTVAPTTRTALLFCRLERGCSLEGGCATLFLA